MRDRSVYMEYNFASKNLRKGKFPTGYVFRSILREEGHFWEEVMDKAFGNYSAGDFEDVMVDNFSYLPERVYILFDEANVPCGTASAWLQPWIWGDDCGYIIFVGVIPSHCGKGLGTEMVQHLNHVIKNRGQEKVLLDVVSDNYSAIKSYLNVGFKPLLTDKSQVAIWEEVFAQLSMTPVEFSAEIRIKKDNPHPPRPYLLDLREQGYMVSKPEYQIIKASKDFPNRLLEFLDDFNKGENGVSGSNVEAPNFSIESYINKLMDMENPEKLKPGYVAESNYWLLDDQGDVIGISKIRHDLTKELLDRGGHISYYLKKSERGKGIGTKLLEKTIYEAKKNGLEKVLITTDADNFSSIKIILNNNGELEDIHRDAKSEKEYHRYWIKL